MDEDCSDNACLFRNTTPSNAVHNMVTSTKAFQSDACKIGIARSLQKNDRGVFVPICITTVAVLIMILLFVWRRVLS